MKSKNIPFILLVVSLSLVSCRVSKQSAMVYIPSEIDPADYTTVTDITENDIRWHMGILASDSMYGRKSATNYEVLAADYIKEQFKSLELKSFSNSYLQDVPITSTKYFNNCELYFNGYASDYPTDFRPMIMFDSLTVAGELVFAGYGFDSDYSDIDVKGKWVMILERNNSILYERKATAKNKGALGVLVIGMDGTSGDGRYVLPVDSTPMIRISHELSDRLFSLACTTVSDVLKKAEANENQDITIPISVRGTIKSEQQPVTSQNVIAYLEANDSGYKNEYIVIGAHYDHIGTQTAGDSLQIFNGADDNASGVVGLLEIAEKMRAGENLKYNIIFVAFGAEELGLIGSRYFCNNPPVPLEKIKFMVNLDMIGRLNPSNIAYMNPVESNDKINAILDEMNDLYPDIKVIPDLDSHLQGSDHTSFFNKKIPVVSFTTGLHKEYHTPADMADLINYSGQKRLLDYIYDFVISPAMDNFIRSFTSSELSP